MQGRAKQGKETKSVARQSNTFLGKARSVQAREGVARQGNA
jgi:hypothetical protein